MDEASTSAGEDGVDVFLHGCVKAGNDGGAEIALLACPGVGGEHGVAITAGGAKEADWLAVQ